MTLQEQLLYVETHFPDAWEYLHDIAGVSCLPKFDDNDDVVSWGSTPAEKEDKKHA